MNTTTGGIAWNWVGGQNRVAPSLGGDRSQWGLAPLGPDAHTRLGGEIYAEFLADPRVQRLGRRVSAALLTQNVWVVRTLEQVTFVERGMVRSNVTRNFRVPSDPDARPIEHGVCYLPVFSIRKSDLLDAELRDGNGDPIWLTSVEARWRLMWLAAMASLKQIAGTEVFREDIAKRLWLLVRSPPQKAEVRVGAVLGLADRLRDSNPLVAAALETDAFVDLITYLAENLVVFVPTSLDVPTQSVQYQIERPILGPGSGGVLRRLMQRLGLAPWTYLHSWPISGAGSNHLEIQVPPGLQLGTRVLSLPTRLPIVWRGTSTLHARFMAPRTTQPGEARAEVQIAIGSGIMRLGGPAVAILTTILVGLFAAYPAQVTGDAAAAGAIVLVIPGLASLVAARPDE